MPEGGFKNRTFRYNIYLIHPNTNVSKDDRTSFQVDIVTDIKTQNYKLQVRFQELSNFVQINRGYITKHFQTISATWLFCNQHTSVILIDNRKSDDIIEERWMDNKNSRT